jgi:transposase
VELLLSNLCRFDQEGAGRGLSQGLGTSQDYIASLQGWISTAYLPPYAPELNPVEYIWGYWKQHELPNVCPKDYWQLSEAARRTLPRMRRRPRLITAFWKQSSLWSE